MLQIITGSLLLSLVHAAIPNHWLPLVAIGRAEKWTRTETLAVTAITGFAHTMSTILIGLIVGLLGYRLSAQFSFITSVIAPLTLIVLGVVYLVLAAKGGRRHHHHFGQTKNKAKVSKPAIVVSLSIAMFFSPCIEIEVYFFSAGTQGWAGIWIVSTIYLFVTVLGMLLLVDLGLKGAKKIRSQFLEHHEKTITGIILIATGIAAYLIEA